MGPSKSESWEGDPTEVVYSLDARDVGEWPQPLPPPSRAHFAATFGGPDEEG